MNRIAPEGAPRLNSSWFYRAAVPVYLCVTFFRFYVQSENIFNALTVILVAYGLVLLILILRKLRVSSLNFQLVFGLGICALLPLVASANDNALVLPQWLANVGYSFAVVNAWIGSRRQLMLCLALFGFFGAHILVGTSPDAIFTISRNFVSILVVLAVSLYFISCYQEGRYPALYVPMLGLIVVLWGVGRAGIISGLLLLGGAAIIAAHRFRTKVFIAVVSLAGIGLAQIYADASLDTLTYGITRFSVLSGQSQRVFINSEYLHATFASFSNFVLGVPLNEVPSIVQVDGNPHNSFIRLHVGFGMAGFLLFFIMLAIGVRSGLGRSQYLILLVLTVSIFRAAVDSAAFHGPLDIVIFYCLFTLLEGKRFVLGRSTLRLT